MQGKSRNIGISVHGKGKKKTRKRRTRFGSTARKDKNEHDGTE